MDILAQALELGLVTRTEVERGLVAAGPGAGTGQRVVALRGRIVATVREAAASAPIARVLAALEALAADDLAAPVLPSTDGRLWTAALAGRTLAELSAAHHSAPTAGDSTLADLTAGCVALGTSLAAVHRLPADRRPRPDVPCTAISTRSVRNARDTALGAEIRHALDADHGIRVAAETVRERWSDRNWTIGRIAPENVSVDVFWRARFTDLGSAGLGDPDWDVAACLASIALVADSVPATVAWLSEHFWNSYRRCGGPGRVRPQMQAMYAIDAAWRAADPAAQDAGGGPRVRWWLDRAHRVVARTSVPGLAA